jgi:hypothetical protein
VTGRLGVAFDRLLFYRKGGVAWAGDKYTDIGTLQSGGFGFEGLDLRTGWTWVAASNGRSPAIGPSASNTTITHSGTGRDVGSGERLRGIAGCQAKRSTAQGGPGFSHVVESVMVEVFGEFLLTNLTKAAEAES